MHSKFEKKEPKMMLRLVSLLLALLLWVNYSGRVDVSASEKERTFQQILLTYTNAPEHIEILNNQGVYLHIVISGPDKELEAISATDLVATLSLEGSQRGDRTFPITKDNISLPPRYKKLEVVSVVPDRVNLSLEHMTSKKLRLHLSVSGLPASDFEVVSEKVTPEEVTIKGPTNRIEELSMLISRPVNIEGARETVSGAFQVADDLPRGAFLIDRLATLRYEIEIAEKRRKVKADRGFTLVTEIQAGEEAQWQGWQVPKTPLSLTYTGPISVTRWFDPAWVEPTIKLAGPMPLDDGLGINDPQQTPLAPENTRRFPVTSRWKLPQEVRAEVPDWLDRVATLELTWSPATVEVKKP